jgi:putative Mg2+ transporter-C (MgtC) family protein
MMLTVEDLLKILLAILAGGVIGLEREFRDKAAGFRTLIFISAGAAVFTILSIRIGAGGDPGRIAAGLVTGVGFLGAGVIMKEEGRVIGLTTAATIWFIAALGMGFGAGEYTLSLIMTAIGLVVLWIFPAIEHRIGSIREDRAYEVIFPYRPKKVEALEALIRGNHLRITARKQYKTGNRMTCTWYTIGSPEHHERLLQALLQDKGIESLRY